MQNSRPNDLSLFNRLLLLAILALVILVAGLGFEEFRREKSALLNEAASHAAERHGAVQEVLADADRQLRRMRAAMELRLASEGTGLSAAGRGALRAVEVDAAGRRFAGLEWRLGNRTSGNLIAVPDLAERPAGQIGPVDAALALLPHLQSEAAAGSPAAWSYFLSGKRDFAAILPGASLAELVSASPKPVESTARLIEDWLGYDVFRLGLPETNPEGNSYWTAPYEDAGGRGMMVSHGAPVRTPDGAFLGVVGTDIALASFAGLLDDTRQPLGFAAILGEGGGVLGVEGASFDGDAARQSAYLTEHGLAEAPPGNAFSEVGSDQVLVRALGETPYRLVHVVPGGELRAELLPRFIPYALILAAVTGTVIAAFLFLHRAYVAPSLALASFVRGVVNGQNPFPPKLPARWQAQIQAISQAFEGAREDRRLLEESESRYRSVVNTQTELVARLSPEGRVLFFNDAYRRYFGMSGEELLARPESDFDVVVAEDRERHDAHIRALSPANPVATIEIRNRLPGTDTVRWEEWTDTGIFDAEGRLVEIQSVGRDITAKRAAEEALAETRARFDAFMEHAPVAIIAKDREARFTLVNPEAARRLRHPPGEIVGRRTVDILPPDEAAVMDRSVRRVLESGAMEVETQEHPSLEPFVHSLFIRFPLKGPSGAVDGVGVFVVDQTAQVKAAAEVERQRDALHQSEKLTALGSLLAGVAHELNNPLAIVVGYSEMLHALAPDEATKHRAHEVHQAATRCARIVRTFLAMVRAKPAERCLVSLTEVMEDVLELAAYGLRANGIDVVREEGGAPPAVFADPDQLHQVFMNVVVNAQQAMMGQEAPRRLHVRFGEDGGQAVAEITDTGSGISAEVQRRAFDPFFTTKPQGVGTGIGLAVCRTIVEAHGGTITLLPGQGGGTVCRIALPGSVGAGADEAASVPENPARAVGRVLVVDDEPAISDFLAEYLAADGIDTAVAASGTEALAILEDASFDAVLSDLRMPDIGGARLAERIAERWPAMSGRIVIMTGDALAGENELRHAGLPFIEKPIDRAALRASLLPLMPKSRA
ncbi:MAG: hypothetical protein DI629_06430 [Mesorhizobium amorphae]|nr:MAG: hypothetical protein DI629_06430 [Mesorhizobium amorphae]